MYHGYFPESGMTPQHFLAFQRAAADLLPGYKRGYPLTIAVRCSNQKSLPWITDPNDFPGKPVYIKTKTDKDTGLVTIADHPKIGSVQEQVEKALRAGFLIVGMDGVARNEHPETGWRFNPLKVTMSGLGQGGWKPAPYQIIDSDAKLPLVSDYDLMGVWPSDRETTIIGIVRDRSQDRGGWRSAMAQLARYEVSDTVSPWADRVAKDINAYLKELGKRPRVMHGAQENFMPADPTKGGGGFIEGDEIVIFLPTQEIEYCDVRRAKAFYAERGRHTAVEPYTNPKLPDNMRKDILESLGVADLEAWRRRRR